MTEFPSAAVIDNKKDELYEVEMQSVTNKDTNYDWWKKRVISLYEYCVNGENNLPALFKETPISREKDEAKVRTILLSYPGYPTYLIENNQYDLKRKLNTFYDNHSTDVFDEDGRLFVHPYYITVVVTSRSANLEDAVKIAINQANSRFAAPDSVHNGMPVATSDDVLDKMSREIEPIVADDISNTNSRTIFRNVPGPKLILSFLTIGLDFIHYLVTEMLECNPMIIKLRRNSKYQSSNAEYLLPDIKSIGVTPANEDENEDEKVCLLVNAKYNERKRSIISEISETKGMLEMSSMGMIIPNPQSAPSSSGPVQQMPFMGESNDSSISTRVSRYFPTSQFVPFSSRHKYESPEAEKSSSTPTPSPFAINIDAIDISKQSPSSVLPQNVQVPVHAREVYCANVPTSITYECLSFNNGTTARIVIREFLIIGNNLNGYNSLRDKYYNNNANFPFWSNGYIIYNVTGEYEKEYTVLTKNPFNIRNNIYFPDIKGWADESLRESLAQSSSSSSSSRPQEDSYQALFYRHTITKK
jgi:hypothetical protein